jgi:release factor glutamine methyltransferase
MSPTNETNAPTRLVLLDRAAERLTAAGRDAPRRTAAWLLMEVLGCDQGQLYAHPEREVAPDEAQQFEGMVDRCAAGEPLQHVLGYAVFRGLRLAVSPAVMVPRPETEEVVEAALARIADAEAPRVLDVGTGSGCIALAVKHERPDAVVQAWDVSPDALAVARDNADRLGLDVSFAEVDLFADALHERLPHPVDLLVSNPPYIPDEEAESLPAVVHDYDPHVALFAGDDPLRFYRALAARAPVLCAPGAAVVLETHADYAEEAADTLRAEGLDDVRLQDDLSGRPRILTARYRAAS